MRRRGDPVQGAAGTDGPHRAGLPGGAHLVFEEPAQQDRQPPGPDPQRAGEDPLFRGLRGRGRGRHRSDQGHAPERGKIPPVPGRVRQPVQGGHGGRGHPGDVEGRGTGAPVPASARRNAQDRLRRQAQEAGQTAQDHRRLQGVRPAARVDGHGGDSGAASGPQAPGAPGRRPLRHLAT